MVIIVIVRINEKIRKQFTKNNFNIDAEKNFLIHFIIKRQVICACLFYFSQSELRKNLIFEIII